MKNEKGMTLIEALASITIFSIFLFAAYSIMGTGYKLFNKKLKNYTAESAAREFFRVFENDGKRLAQIDDDGFLLESGVRYKIDGSAVLRITGDEKVFDFSGHDAGLIEFRYLDADLKETRKMKNIRFIRIVIDFNQKTRERLFSVSNDTFN